jgi:uncharacterized protein YbjT (DUF2867 family)
MTDQPVAPAMPFRDLPGAEAVAALRNRQLLLAGATGRNGRVVLEMALALGLKVRAMTRNAASARAAHGDGAEWIEADVTAPDSLAAALRDVEVVISAVATARPFGRNRPEKVDYEGTVNLAKAARAAGARRFVIITSSSSGKRNHFLNYIGRNVLVWKGRAEAALAASGLESVVIGPARMNDDPPGVREIRLIPRADYRPGMTVTRGDTAAAVLAAAGLPAAANRTFTVCNGDGPASPAWPAQFASMPRA